MIDVEEKETSVVGKSLAVVVYEDFFGYKSYRRKGWEPIARKALRFYFGDHWSQEDKYYLEKQKRAPAVFNVCLPAVDLIAGHQIQNRIDFIASPVDRYADAEIADVITSVIKHIENNNDATLERRFQFLDGIISGIGIIENWYDTEKDIEGEIRMRQGSAWHYYLDPHFEKYDYSDGRKLFKETWMDKYQIERLYGKKVLKKIRIPESGEVSELPQHTAMSNWANNPSNDYGNLSEVGYDSGDYESDLYTLGFDKKKGLIRVIEQYEKVWKEVKIYSTLSGGIAREDELTDEEKEDAIELTTRYVPHIELTTLVGLDVIPKEYKKRELPNDEFSQLFNFFFPYFVNGRYMGVLENVFYPQEEINKVHSSLIHMLNTMARKGIHYQDGAMNPEYEGDIENILGQPTSIIKWDELYDESGRPNYVIEKPENPPEAFFRVMSGEQDMVKYIAGAIDAIQGITQRAQSGKAKQTDIAQASVRLTPIIENFRETQKAIGKSHIWWIQNYYTTEKFIRIRGDDYEGNDPQMFVLNERIYDKIANDITIGKYDIILKKEGKTPTERDRLFWKYVELARTFGPEYAPIFMKLALQMSEIPNKREIEMEMQQIKQFQMQMQQMGAAGKQQGGARGAVQSAPRPQRGTRREPAAVRQQGTNPF